MKDLFMESFYGLELRDKSGRIIEKLPLRPSQSFVKNFYNHYVSTILAVTPSEANDLDYRRTTGAVFTTYSPITMQGRGWRGVEATQADAGILCGSGDTAENFGMGAAPDAMSYKLDTIIANGITAGTLERASTEQHVITQDGGSPLNTYTFTWERYFNNKSGGDVIVREIGMYAYLASVWVMFCRDVLASPLTINDTGQLKVTYALSLPFPAA